MGQTPESGRIFPSLASIDSDSNYDSGAFSRNSTPEPGLALPPAEPLKSPPLVISVNRNNQLSSISTLPQPYEESAHATLSTTGTDIVDEKDQVKGEDESDGV